MLFASVLAACALAGGSQEPREGDFILDRVQVWDGDAEPSAPRTLWLREGRAQTLASLEEALALAPGAAVIEAEDGWILYPGLVHADYPAKLAEATASPYAERASDPREGAIPSFELGDHHALRGWLRVADTLAWDPEQGKAWREAGFTSAQVLPRHGVVRGRGALLSLNGLPAGSALLEREGRLVLAARGAGRGYPQTPMAALALLRQVFLDAARHAEGRDGRFVAPDLDGIEAGILLADGAREIENALDLLRDFGGGGRGAVLLGGAEAWKLAARLREQEVGILYRLDLPEAPKPLAKLELAPAESRPWWQTPERVLAERRRLHAERVADFRLLRESGVRCALVPKGSPDELAKALAQLEADGLDRDGLYRALSLDVAELLGGGPGADAADFVLSRGAYDFAAPDLAWIFAGGRAWRIEAEEDEAKEKDDGEEDEDGGATLAGDWKVELDTPVGDRSFGVELRPADGEVMVFQLEQPAERGAASQVEFDGPRVSFRFTAPELDAEMSLAATLAGDQGSGTLDTPFGELAVTLRRLATAPADDAGQEVGAGAGDLELGHPEWLVELPADRRPAHALDGDVLLRGGTLYTLTGEEPFAGDLLILDGRIAAVGGELAAPAGVPELDARGWHLMPGILDAHSHLALDAINEGSLAITAECRVGDMIHPEQVEIFRAAAGGTAINQSLHGSANPIGGEAAVWELDVARPTIAELLLPGAPRGIKFALGENVVQASSPGRGQRFPNTRAGVQAVYRQAFAAAEDYARRRAAWERGELPSFRRDLRLETLAAILANEVHVQCHGYRADELLMFLGICREFGIERPTFQHVLEGYKVAPELAAFGAMASTFADWWAYKLEVVDAIPWNPALLTRAGVIATINSDSGEMIRRLNTEAGKSLRYGRLDWQEAMALCTRNAAIQLRLADRLGALAVGFDGTVSVFDAPPLSTAARCVLTLARGRVLFERPAEHDAAWRDYADAAARFAGALAAAAEPAAPPPPAAEDAIATAASWQRWTRAGQGLAYLIRDARVHPVSAPPFHGEVLIEDGRFAWLGERWEGALPPSCIVIEAGGLHLYPGFVNDGDATGVWEIGSIPASRDDAETGDDHPELSLAAAIHADSRHHRVTRANGITHVLVCPTRGRLRGQAALIQLDGETPSELVVEPDLALAIGFPRAAEPKEGKEPEPPEELAELDDWFERALEEGVRQERLAAAGTPPLARDPRLDALLPYARGAKPVLIEATDTPTLMAARAWVAKRGLTAIYAGADEAWKVAGFLGADRARVIAGPVHALPPREEDPWDAPFRNPGVLAAAGCRVALRTADPEVTRNLPFQAATAAAHGWSLEAALRALTLGAAEVVGVERFTGSIEVGKAANLFLAEDDPLDFPGVVRRMWIGGREVELSSHHTELRDRYAARIERARAQR